MSRANKKRKAINKRFNDMGRQIEAARRRREEAEVERGVKFRPSKGMLRFRNP